MHETFPFTSHLTIHTLVRNVQLTALRLVSTRCSSIPARIKTKTQITI